MNTSTYKIHVGGIPVEVVRKDIKNLHLAVYPPEGRVRIAVPNRVDDEAVRLAVVSKLGWIRKRQAKFTSQERQSLREYVSGENHFVAGKRYRMRLVPHEGKAQVRLLVSKATIHLLVSAASSREKREATLMQWYRQRLKNEIPELIARWEAVIGVKVSAFGVKKMRTKWGSCNISAKRIWLNVELAKKPSHCLEYVVVHEMVHLLERHHNERFVALMDHFLPQWKNYRSELNKCPLSHENWEC